MRSKCRETAEIPRKEALQRWAGGSPSKIPYLCKCRCGKDFRQMAEHNIPVLEMKTVTKSLEDVFLEITQEGGAQ